MKALIHANQEGIEGLTFGEAETKEPQAGEVRVSLKAAGLNHRDLFVLYRHRPTEPPLILGSDGAGVVDAVGKGVDNVAVGDEVILYPAIGWPHQSDAPPKGFEIIGHPGDGTFAEQVIVPSENALPKPSFLTWEEAGVLSLPALTAYRALFTRGQANKDTTLFIPGIGSGVATFLLQFAKAVGATVYVTSRSEEKRQKALELGADKALSNEENWKEALAGEKVDVVIESVGAATFQRSLDVLRPGGTLVTFGASAGDEININLREFFYGQYNMLGSTMGSLEEYKNMLAFIEKEQIKPVMDKMYSLEQYKDAFERLNKAEQFGKIGFIIAP